MNGYAKHGIEAFDRFLATPGWETYRNILFGSVTLTRPVVPMDLVAEFKEVVATSLPENGEKRIYTEWTLSDHQKNAIDAIRQKLEAV